MGEDQAEAKPICFWCDSGYNEIKTLADRGAPGLKWHMTTDSPGNGVILAMGTERLKRLQAAGHCHKGRTIDSLRGTVINHPQGPVLLTYAPGMRHSKADAMSQIIWDVRLAARLATRGHMNAVTGTYKWEDDLAEFIEQIELNSSAINCTPVDVGFDTETMGLDPYLPEKHIVSVQFSHTEGMAVCVYMLDKSGAHRQQLIHQIKWLLNSPKIKIKGANLKYDLTWIWVKWGMQCSNFTMDTTVIGSILDENRSNSLKWHLKEYTPTFGGYESAFEAKYDKAHMENVPKDDPDFLQYAAGDADGVLRVANIFRKELSKEKYLQHLYVKLVHPAVRAWEKVERRGIPVDTKRYAELREELSEFIDYGEKEMVKMMSPRLRAKLDDKLAERKSEGKSPLTPAMLGDHFFSKDYGLGLTPKMITERTKKPSTANEHLTKFFDTPGVKEFVKVMQDVGTARKIRSTYVDGFLEDLRTDGRFHPTYAFFKGDLFDKGDAVDDAGTNTGRLSARNPSWQTLIKHDIPGRPSWAKKIRSCFPAPPGYTYWSKDFKQGELRVVACWANEENMIQVYTPGTKLNEQTQGDMHALTGSRFANMDVVAFLALQYVDEQKTFFKRFRQNGKHGNFGMLFGISPEGFQAYAWRKGVPLTLDEATKYLEDFMSLYPGLPRYHNNQRQIAAKDGFVIGPFGQIRHLPLINSPNWEVRGHEERRAINSPIQSTLSHMCAWAVARVEEELGDEAGVNGMIHDSIHGLVETHKAKTIIPQISQIMESLPYTRDFNWEPQLTFPTDGEFGPSLGELHDESELFASGGK